MSIKVEDWLTLSDDEKRRVAALDAAVTAFGNKQPVNPNGFEYREPDTTPSGCVRLKDYTLREQGEFNRIWAANGWSVNWREEYRVISYLSLRPERNKK